MVDAPTPKVTETHMEAAWKIVSEHSNVDRHSSITRAIAAELAAAERGKAEMLAALEQTLSWINEECRDRDGAEEIPGVNDITVTLADAIAAAKEVP